MLHYAEIRTTNIFNQFDYGNKIENVAHYGADYAITPPLIDLTKIRDSGVPVAMYVGKQDVLATPTDAQWTKTQIGKQVIEYTEIDNFDHSAFNFGKDMTFLDGVMDLVAVSNPLPEEFTDDSKIPQKEFEQLYIM